MGKLARLPHPAQEPSNIWGRCRDNADAGQQAKKIRLGAGFEGGFIAMNFCNDCILLVFSYIKNVAYCRVLNELAIDKLHDLLPPRLPPVHGQ